jgi:hypothetical protein
MFASGAELAITPPLVVVSNGPVPEPLPFATTLEEEVIPAPPILLPQLPVLPGATPGAI